MTFLWALLKPYAFKLLLGLAIAGAVVAVLLRVRHAGRMAERLEQKERAYVVSKEQARIAARPRDPAAVLDSLRKHEF